MKKNRLVVAVSYGGVRERGTLRATEREHSLRGARIHRLVKGGVDLDDRRRGERTDTDDALAVPALVGQHRH